MRWTYLGIDSEINSNYFYIIIFINSNHFCKTSKIKFCKENLEGDLETRPAAPEDTPVVVLRGARPIPDTRLIDAAGSSTFEAGSPLN